MIRFDYRFYLCGYSDAYIIIKETITVDGVADIDK